MNHHTTNLEISRQQKQQQKPALESSKADGFGAKAGNVVKLARQLVRGDVVLVGTLRNPEAKQRRTVLDAHTVFGLSVRVRFLDGTERAFADDDAIELVGSGDLPPLSENERAALWRQVFADTHPDFKGRQQDGGESLMSWAQFGGGLVSLATITDLELRLRAPSARGVR